jgi:rhodanese-related sulfurtransferase
VDGAPQLTPAEASELLSGGAFALDVREVEEWDAGHVEGSRWIPLGRLGGQLEGLPRDRVIVVVCRTGSRSGYVADALAGMGIDARNLAGGLHAWTRAGLPLVPAGGYVL